MYMEFAMPILENPEVIHSHYTSGLASFRQAVRSDVAPDYETDVGVNDPMGLNVLSNAVQIYHPPVQGDKSHGISMSLYLSEEWAQKNEFIARMAQDHGVKVQEEPVAWGSTMTKLQVIGQSSIHTFGKHLRESFAETVHEGATIQRQIVNPALLGTALDHMDAVVAQSQEANQSLGTGWASMKWDTVPAADTYGWRP
jgi:hypothetical protein